MPDPGRAPIELAAPPRLGESAWPGSWAGMIILPLAAGSGSLLVTLTNPGRPLLAAAGLLVLAASVVAGLIMVIGSRTGRRRRARELRERYLDYLEDLRRTLRFVAARQRESAAQVHPDPAEAAERARLLSRRWERRPTDSDFLAVRVGLGPVRLSRSVRLPADGQDPLISYDPVCRSAARGLVTGYGRLDDQPVCLPLARVGSVSVIGTQARTRGLARAVIAQIVAHHAPDEVELLVLRDSGEEAAWDWVKWLPHLVRGGVVDPAPAAGSSADELAALLAARVRHDLESPGSATAHSRQPSTVPRRLVLIVDGPHAADLPTTDRWGGRLVIHQIHLLGRRLDEPERVDVRLILGSRDRTGPSRDLVEILDPALDPDAIGWTGVDGVQLDRTVPCRFDDLTAAGAALLARTLAPWSDAGMGEKSTDHVWEGLPDILGVSDVAALNPTTCWRPRTTSAVLRVPIGADPRGQPVVLDLKESAVGGMGPHGLVVGATGSGKSELLRTLVAALAVRHPPDSLTLLLADFKGGATFSGLRDLPHIAGMITNLADDLSLIDRFRAALGGELLRRQQILADAGNVTDLFAYTELRRRRTDLEPLPRLLVIVDEFSEMLSARPDLADLFVAVGRVGRSIGIHLLLATQRLEMGRIRGLETHLSYRIGLRTFSEAESRDAIGTADAYHLPSVPGSAYLKVDTTVFARFRAGMVTQPYRPPVRARPAPALIMPFTSTNGVADRIDQLHERGERAAGHLDEGAGGQSSGRPTVLDVMVDRLRPGHARSPQDRPARRIWLDPLPPALTFDALATKAGTPGFRGDGDPARVLAPIGLVDLPGEQRQEVLTWDFAGSTGNIVIVGAGMSGKSTALRTLIASLALRYEPGRVAFFCVDCSGGALLPLARLPHVAGVATRSDQDMVDRVFSVVGAMLDERETLMRRHGWNSAARMRRARAEGLLDPVVPADVFLVIDGWGRVGDADGLTGVDDIIAEITTRGPGVGIHTIVTVTSAGQLRSRLAAGFGGRLELRLADSFDSVVDRRLARDLPAAIPGRALVAGGHYAQLALPEINCSAVGFHAEGIPPDGSDAAVGDADDAADALVAAVCARWPGPPIRPLRRLPTMVQLADLRATAKGQPKGPLGTALGLAEHDLRPAWLDWTSAESHLVVFGDPRTGKTALLRSVALQLAAQIATQRAPVAQNATMQVRPGPAGADRFALAQAQAGLTSEVRTSVDGGRSAQFATVDYRRGLAGQIPTAVHRWHADDHLQARQLVAEMVSVLAERLPGSGVTARQPRGRDRWVTPEIFLLVDDYDIVCGAAGNPLLPLLPFLAQGQDIGFHLVLARRCGGASRAVFETVLQTLADLGTPTLMFSGEKSEGRLAHGVAPRRLPTGRALLATRDDPVRVIQTAWFPPRG